MVNWCQYWYQFQYPRYRYQTDTAGIDTYTKYWYWCKPNSKIEQQMKAKTVVFVQYIFCKELHKLLLRVESVLPVIILVLHNFGEKFV